MIHAFLIAVSIVVLALPVQAGPTRTPADLGKFSQVDDSSDGRADIVEGRPVVQLDADGPLRGPEGPVFRSESMVDEERPLERLLRALRRFGLIR